MAEPYNHEEWLDEFFGEWDDENEDSSGAKKGPGQSVKMSQDTKVNGPDKWDFKQKTVALEEALDRFNKPLLKPVQLT